MSAAKIFGGAARLMAGVQRRLQPLARDRSGNSVIEFALVLPVLTTLGMYGIELAYMSVVNMQVSQIAMALADNASRLGQTDNSAVPPSLQPADIDSVMDGAMQQGASIKFAENGRLILSSLEQTSGGRQYIHWQRCRGSYTQASIYGPQGYGRTGTALTGMGKVTPIKAEKGSAVMFVEAYYSYKPLFGTMFVRNVRFGREAAFLIRDDRNLGSSESTDPISTTGRSAC